MKEALIQFDPDTKKPFVEIATGSQKFERREIQLGVSDGIYIQILNGIKPDDDIKVWNEIKPAALGA